MLGCSSRRQLDRFALRLKSRSSTPSSWFPRGKCTFRKRVPRELHTVRERKPRKQEDDYVLGDSKASDEMELEAVSAVPAEGSRGFLRRSEAHGGRRQMM